MKQIGSTALAEGAPGAKAHTVIQPGQGLFHLGFTAIWEHWELLYFLVWRDVKVRYKQTVIGAAWVVLQPVITMILFTIVFSYFAKIPSDGLPYPLFAFTALVPWSYFSQALNRCGVSLVTNTNLVTKVYFPRLLIPLAAVTTPLVDFGLSFLVLLGLMAWYGLVPGWTVAALPVFLLMAVATALAVGLWLSALHVKWRDFGHLTPFLIQSWMYASPVLYPVSLVPERWQLLYGLNPLAGVIEGFRWALLGTASPDFGVMAVSAVVVLILLVGGTVYFNWTERTFVDII